MIILNELILSLILGIAFAGILTALFINNPKIWYETAKKVKNKQKINKKSIMEE